MSSLTNSINTSRVSSGNKMSGDPPFAEFKARQSLCRCAFLSAVSFLVVFGLPSLPFPQSRAFCSGSSSHLCSQLLPGKVFSVSCGGSPAPWAAGLRDKNPSQPSWGGRWAHTCPHGPGLHTGISPSAPPGEETLRAFHNSDYLRGLPPCLCYNIYVLLMGLI